MANILAAIGSAAPALTSEWRSIQAEERQRREEEHKSSLYPIQREAAETGVAVSKANLDKIKQETALKKQSQEKLNAPANYRQLVKKMGLLPEMENQALAIAAAHGIDPESGVGTVDQTMKALDDLIKGDTWKSMSSGMAQYHSVRFEETSRKYQEAKEKGAPLEQLEKLRGEVQKAQGDASKWGGVVTKTTEMIRNREAIGNNIKAMKDSGDWDGLSKMDQLALSQAQESGSETLWKDAMGKILARKETVSKGTDFKVVQDQNSPTGYSYKSLIDPKQPMVQGAPAPKVAGEMTDYQKLSLVQREKQHQESIQLRKDLALAARESKPDQTLITKVMSEIPKLKAGAVSQNTNIKSINTALDLIKKGVTGKGGQVKAFAAPYAEMLGYENTNLSDAQAFQLLTRAIVGPMRLDIVGSGQVSDFEQKLMQQISGGGGTAKASALMLLKHWKTLAEDRISNYNDTLEGLEKIYPKAGEIYKKIKIEEKGIEGKTTTEKDTKGKKSYSQQDLEFTAKKHGISVEEVKRKLGVE